MSPLHTLKIATPCSMIWERMEGNDRVRHCQSCRLNVYDLSAMTTAEGERLLTEGQGRVCVTFFRRADGRVLTKDCGGGFSERFRARTRAARHRSIAFRVWVTITAVVITGLLTGAERLRGALGLTSLNEPGTEGDTQVESQRTRPLQRKRLGEIFRGTDSHPD